MTAAADTTPTIAARVRRGAGLLDRKTPGWAGRIDLEQLQLRSRCSCILGQLHGGDGVEEPYETGLAALGIPPVLGAGWADDYDNGFDLPSWEAGPAAWAELERLWAAEVRARQDGATA